MIERFYHTINILRYSENDDDFSTQAGYEVVGTFQGLVQAPSNSNTFNNGKDTSNVVGVLFCPISVKFESKDIIEDNGIKYIISGQGTQPNGVTGITPHKGQHAEYRLEWAQENV